MLGYLVRTLPVALRARWRRSTGTTVSRLKRRVSLREIDLFLHMNQAAYAQVMELGRVDWAIVSGAYQTWRKMGITFIAAEQTITYRRELRTWATYEVDTRAVGIEGRLLVVD